jgi:hypothetical protein
MDLNIAGIDSSHGIRTRVERGNRSRSQEKESRKRSDQGAAEVTKSTIGDVEAKEGRNKSGE